MRKLIILLCAGALTACASFTADNCLVLPPISCGDGTTYNIRACAAPGTDISNNPAFKAGIESTVAITNQSCKIQK
jgi:hypothetical protein